jgi:tRNA(Arg) A34 adenosine deaminase TadA
MQSDQETVGSLQGMLAGIEPDLRHRDEVQGLHACELALRALQEGGYGVGALVMDEDHKIWAEAENLTFADVLDSAGHAEMRALDRFEQLDVDHPQPCQLTLLATLEPCPMCLSRALYAGMGEVVYIVEDGDGGMVHRRDHLPPALRELAQMTSYRLADVSAPVRQLARSLADAQLAQKRQALMAAHGRA